MLGIAIWSLAVYAAGASVLLAAAHRWVQPMRIRVAILLAAAPLLFTGRATVTDGVYAPLDILAFYEPIAAHHGVGAAPARTPLLSDVVCSSIPWHAAVRDALLHGRLPLWNPFLLGGEPLLAVQQAAPLHPATWLGLLLPLPEAWTLQMSLRLLIALLSAYLLMRELGCSEIPSFAGAAAWAFSDFLVFWLGYSVTNAIGPFPLLALGLLRLARDADRRAAALTAAALVLIVLGGHPEMLLFSVAAGGVWFLFRLRGSAPPTRRRAVALSLVAGAFALGLTAIQLVPLLEALPQTWEHAFREAYYARLTKSVELVASARRATVLVLPFAYGVSGHGALADGFGTPGAYAGSILFPLACAGLFVRRAPRGALVAIGLLGAALWSRLALVTDAIARLPFFRIGVLDYMVFALVFALAVLAAFGAEGLCRGEGRGAFLWGAALTLAAAVALYLHRRPGMRALGMADGYVHGRLAWELVPLAAATALVALAAARPRIGGVAAAAGCLALLLVSRVGEAGGIYPTAPAAAFYPDVPVLDAIPRGKTDRIVGLGPMLLPNAASVYGLEDVRGYESMTLLPLVQTYPLWSRPLGAWFNIVEDLSRPFLSFLNVRWAIAPHDTPPPPGWAVRKRTPAGDLLENSRVLPRAFVPMLLRSVPGHADRLKALDSIDDFSRQGVLSEPAATGEWISNGGARVAIERYEPQAMTLSVEAHETAVVATSVPAWKGWRVLLDGKRVEPLTYNHAFLGFRVPAGRHRVQLRYLPASFIAGMIVSLSTLTLAAFLLTRRARPRAGLPS